MPKRCGAVDGTGGNRNEVCGRDVPLFRRFSESLLRYGGKCCIICKEHPFAGQIWMPAFGRFALRLPVRAFAGVRARLLSVGACLRVRCRKAWIGDFSGGVCVFLPERRHASFLILWDGDASEVLRNPVWKCRLPSAAQLCFFMVCLAGAVFRRRSSPGGDAAATGRIFARTEKYA